VGLALLLGFLLTGLVAAGSRLRTARGPDGNVIAALTAVVIAFAFAAGIDWIWQLTVVPVVAIVALGLLTGPATAPATAAPATSRGRPRRSVALRAGVVVACLCLVVAQGIPLLAQDDVRRSQHRFAAGNLDGARDAALSARSVQPWAASPHLQLALVDERRGDLRSARSAIAKAIDRDPLDWRLWLTSARIDGESGRPEEASARLDRAIELNPRSPLLASLRKDRR
jgi:hypothetical protein